MMAAERWRDGAAQSSVVRLVDASPRGHRASYACCRLSALPSSSISARRRSGGWHQRDSVSVCWQRGQTAAAPGFGSRLTL